MSTQRVIKIIVADGKPLDDEHRRAVFSSNDVDGCNALLRDCRRPARAEWAEEPDGEEELAAALGAILD